MHEEYKAITDAGFLLQIDDPDLADAWQIHADMDVEDYAGMLMLRVESINVALRASREKAFACTSAGAASTARTRTTSP